MENAVRKTSLGGLSLLGRGKVRDIYDLDKFLLLVASDRVSAFDVVMDETIPGKGKILTEISLFWFKMMRKIIDNHVLSAEVDDFPVLCPDWATALKEHQNELRGRSMLVVKAKPLPVECIVRGYLSGSGWKEYQKTQSVCNIILPAGLLKSEILPEPIFTPSTKAEEGLHDENISFARAKEILGPSIAEKVKAFSLAIYKKAREFAARKGIIITDTKFEFGLWGDDLILIDELLTPDSSRFWPADKYQPGGAQPSFDKQFLRDWLEGQDWNKQPPPPTLPADIIRITAEKYQEAREKLIGNA